MFVESYLNTAVSLLHTYDGSVPFHHYLKKFFSEHKKFGSRDRKQITQLAYSYFRLGKALHDVPTEERLLIALFLCSNSNAILEQKKWDWNAVADKKVEYKWNWLQQFHPFAIEAIFPFKGALSEAIDHKAFCFSFLVQPLLFLRIRQGKKVAVEKKLREAGQPYELPNSDCIALPNTSKIDQVITLDEEAVVQDYSSQQVLQPLLPYQFDQTKKAWDCCAASGGKSILLRDSFPQINLTVSDVRSSILINLQNRFKRAGIKNYKWRVLDVASDHFDFKEKFDLIICDAPCSGSGTWSRTPEQLYFFDEKKIDYYAALQKKIVHHASHCLKKDGFFLYITCSVFKAENEEVVRFIQEELKLRLLHMNYYKGYTHQADTLFAALFTAL